MHHSAEVIAHGVLNDCKLCEASSSVFKISVKMRQGAVGVEGVWWCQRKGLGSARKNRQKW